MSAQQVAAALRTVRRNQGGILPDTNVLLVHLADQAGVVVGDWKRTQAFTDKHATLLRALCGEARRLVNLVFRV